MRQRRLSRWAVAVVGVGLLVVGLLVVAPLGDAARDSSGGVSGLREYDTTATTVAPSTATTKPHPPGARALSARLHERLLEMRRAQAAQAAARDQEPIDVTEHPAPAAVAPAPQFHGTPTDFIATFKENTLADDAVRASQISEPSAANEGTQVMMAGNFYRSRSVNQGTTWTNLPIPAGPATAATFCCDTDTVYDQSRGVTFQSFLYFRDFDADPAPDNGIVRIFVRREMALADDCFFDIDPDGATNNVLPDFPHIGLSNNQLYLATNETTNGGGQTARMRRFNVDQMADCVAATTAVFSMPSATMGQRVFRPVEGARDTMYWGALIGAASSASLRVFKWPESSATVSSSDIALAETSLFGDTDCRGGTNNADWWDAGTATVTGFELVGAVGGNVIEFLWDTKNGTVHTQGHIHGVRLREKPTIVNVGNVVIQNPNFCIGFPAIAANERGDFGMSLAAGGKAGGAGPAIQAWAGLDDDLDGGTLDFVVIKSGTHMPNAGRYGDYFTVHPFEPCDQFFNATNYVFTGGGAATNVDALYVNFGRGRESPCFNGWRDENRTP